MDKMSESHFPTFEQIKIEKDQQSTDDHFDNLSFEQIAIKKDRLSSYPGIANVDPLSRPKKGLPPPSDVPSSLKQVEDTEKRAQEQKLEEAKERLLKLGIVQLYSRAEALILSLNQHARIDNDTGFSQDVLRQCLLVAFQIPDDKQLIHETANVIEKAYKEEYLNILKKFLIAEGVCDDSGKILFTPRLIKLESTHFLQASKKFDLEEAKEALDNIIAIADLFDTYNQVRETLRSKIEKDAEQYATIQAIPSEGMSTVDVNFQIDTKTQQLILQKISEHRNHEIAMSIYLSTKDRKNYFIRGVDKVQTGESGRVASEGSLEYQPGEVEIHTHPENLNQRYHHATSDGDLIGALDSPEWVDPLKGTELPHQRIFGVLTIERKNRKTLQVTLQLYLVDLNIVKNKLDKSKDLGKNYGTMKFGKPIVFPTIAV